MKKTYQNPQTQVYDVNVEQMLAVSGYNELENNAGLNKGTGGDIMGGRSVNLGTSLLDKRSPWE